MSITAETLTSWLSSYGSINSGHVEHLSSEPAGYVSTLSSMERLAITYSTDASGTCPLHCLAKLSSPETFMLGALEANFYLLMREHQFQNGLPQIYAVHIDQAAQSSAVLMEELQQTNPPTEWPIPPDLETCHRAVDALANFHGAWANTELAINTFKAQEASGRFGAERMSGLAEALINRLGDGLSTSRQTLLLDIAARYPVELTRRFTNGSNGTLAHGDAHFWNFLFPADSSKPAVMVDWQLWCADLGTADLAYMLGLHWFPERRQRFERDLVSRYADACNRPAEQTWEDYRFSASGLIARAALYASVIPAAVWWPHLERAFNVFDDLGCAEFYA